MTTFFKIKFEAFLREKNENIQIHPHETSVVLSFVLNSQKP